ncbi:MAG: hypothetical protein ACRD2I_11970 [Vicinamibacterales bacterium]
MDLTEAVLRLFGLVSQWNTRARGFGLLLLLPIVVIAIADWRVRRRR